MDAHSGRRLPHRSLRAPLAPGGPRQATPGGTGAAPWGTTGGGATDTTGHARARFVSIYSACPPSTLMVTVTVRHSRSFSACGGGGRWTRPAGGHRACDGAHGGFRRVLPPRWSHVPRPPIRSVEPGLWHPPEMPSESGWDQEEGAAAGRGSAVSRGAGRRRGGALRYIVSRRVREARSIHGSPTAASAAAAPTAAGSARTSTAGTARGRTPPRSGRPPWPRGCPGTGCCPRGAASSCPRSAPISVCCRSPGSPAA